MEVGWGWGSISSGHIDFVSKHRTINKYIYTAGLQTEQETIENVSNNNNNDNLIDCFIGEQ